MIEALGCAHSISHIHSVDRKIVNEAYFKVSLSAQPNPLNDLSLYHMVNDITL